MTAASFHEFPAGFCFLTALVTGAVVMALEILGSRLLAPYLGVRCFVWGALIGVILAAIEQRVRVRRLDLDRYTGGGVLAVLLLFSGSWTFLVAWANQPILFEIEKMVQDPRWGPCLAATVLLAPPAFGLSGVVPAMLRLAVADMEHLGRQTGRMIALSDRRQSGGRSTGVLHSFSYRGSEADR